MEEGMDVIVVASTHLLRTNGLNMRQLVDVYSKER